MTENKPQQKRTGVGLYGRKRMRERTEKEIALYGPDRRRLINESRFKAKMKRERL